MDATAQRADETVGSVGWVGMQGGREEELVLGLLAVPIQRAKVLAEVRLAEGGFGRVGYHERSTQPSLEGRKGQEEETGVLATGIRCERRAQRIGKPRPAEGRCEAHRTEAIRRRQRKSQLGRPLRRATAMTAIVAHIESVNE